MMPPRRISHACRLGEAHAANDILMLGKQWPCPHSSTSYISFVLISMTNTSHKLLSSYSDQL